MSLGGGRTPLARSLGLALVMIGAVVVLFGAVEIVLVSRTPGPMWLYVGFTLVAWVHLTAGLLAWWRRPSNRIGPLLVAGSLVWIVADLVNTEVPVLIAAGSVAATFSLALVVHLLLAFPSGRLPTRAARVTVAAGWFTSFVLQAPLYLFTPADPPYDLLTVADRPHLARAGAVVQAVLGISVMLVAVVLILQRLRRADRARRRVLLPLYAYGIVAMLVLPVGAAMLQPLHGVPLVVLVAAQIVVVAGVPVALVLGMLRGGFAQTGEVEELATWLGSDGAQRHGLARALARSLGDDSVEVVFWLPSREAYVDAAGDRAALPVAGSGRAAVEVELAGHRIGAIVHDATLVADPEMVRAAGRVMALAVERERLTAELRASDAALRRSRTRLVEAADRERRRIARNLHDGLQVRLVLLALDAQRIADSADDGTAGPAATLRAGIDDAAAELRGLVHAVMPAALVESGLAAATEDLVDRVPLVTRLELAVPDGVLPAAVESTAYFVVAEATANALKHSGASRLHVGLAHRGDTLRVEVADDGTGGADPTGGTGLRGLVDRVGALGGRLELDSPAGGGTRLVVELPCGS